MKFVSIVFFLVGTLAFGQRSDFDTISFFKADSIALQNKDASLKNLPVLVHHLTSDLATEVEKFRAIYTWVCTNIENDYGSYQKTVKKRKKLSNNPEALAEWNNSFTPKVFKKLVTHKKTACTGYAFLIRELANLAGINCKIINGYGRTPTLSLNENSIPNHSWNTVELNGKWYLCDPTWSAGRIILEEDGPRFEADYFDSYFLAEPELFVRNHYPIKIENSLLKQAPTFNEFIAGPVVYRAAFKLGVLPISPLQMQLKISTNEQLSFSLKASQNLAKENIELLLSSGIRNKIVKPNLVQSTNNYLLYYSFKKPGKYDVHIKIDEVIVATYVVQVKR